MRQDQPADLGPLPIGISVVRHTGNENEQAVGEGRGRERPRCARMRQVVTTPKTAWKVTAWLSGTRRRRGWRFKLYSRKMKGGKQE